MSFTYLSLPYALAMHGQVLELSGGLPGVKDEGALDSILHHIQNDDYYPSFEEKLTHLVFAVNKGHCYNDANKRTSIVLGAFFLELNNQDYLVNRFIVEMENIAVHVADNIIDKDLLGKIITSLLYEEDFSETLKLNILTALSNAVNNE